MELDGGVLIPGARHTGRIWVNNDKAIPRARRFLATFRGEAWAKYQRPNNCVDYSHHTLFRQPLIVELPEGGLPPGRHCIPFALSMPPTLPVAAYIHGSCGLGYWVDVELDVDWAIDPKATLAIPAQVQAGVVVARREPWATRLRAQGRDNLVVELSLASRVVRHGEPIHGHVAIRGAGAKDVEHITVSLGLLLHLRFAAGDARFGEVVSITRPMAGRSEGESVPFILDTGLLVWDQVNGVMDVSHALRLALPSSYHVPEVLADEPIFVLPAGSQLSGEGESLPIGHERMERIADWFVGETAGVRGRFPVLVRFTVSGIVVTFEDAGPGELRIWWHLPPLAFGLELHQRGLLRALTLRGVDQTPSALAGSYIVSSAPESPLVPPGLVLGFLDTFCVDLGLGEVSLSDARLGRLESLPADDVATLRSLLDRARMRASAMAAAVAALPFLTPGADPARWREAAVAEGAMLLPHRPAIIGIRRQVRTTFGELREFSVDVITHVNANGAITTELRVRALSIVVPAQVAADGVVDEAEAMAWLGPLRSRFTEMLVPSPGLLTLVAAGAALDPRPIIEAADAATQWFLAQIGERRADGAYR